MAVDGKATTRWSTAWIDAEWWQVDLGARTRVASVSIDWADDYCARYQVRTSTDLATFDTAAETTASGPGTKTTTFAARDARYVRIFCFTSGTRTGTSFWEARIYGPTGSPPSPPPSSSSPATGDLATGKPATASSTRGAPYAAGMAVDGKATTRWSTAWIDAEWWQVDLGARTRVASVSIDWADDYCARYQVRTSTDLATFDTAAETTASGPGTKTTTFAARDARYVRIFCFTSGTRTGTSFWEARIYGPTGSPPSPPPSSSSPATGDLATGKPATASSTRGAPYAAGMAVDGKATTRWSTAWIDAEWWQVDLGARTRVASVSIDWADDYCARYQVRTSTDLATFDTAAETTASGPGTKTTTFAARDARYVRIFCFTSGTRTGTSFWEARIYGS